VCKRSTSWLKWKPTITVDLEVIDFEEGTGVNKNSLGAIVFSGIDQNRKIKVNVGSGYSEDDRKYIWEHKDEFRSRIGEIVADAVTQNQDGSYSLRFPRFGRWRDVLTGKKE
jgi:DNA ligase-1